MKAVLVGWQPIGRRYSWWPTRAAPASLIPGCRCIHLRFVGYLNKRIFIYLFIYFRSEFVLVGLQKTNSQTTEIKTAR